MKDIFPELTLEDIEINKSSRFCCLIKNPNKYDSNNDESEEEIDEQRNSIGKLEDDDYYDYIGSDSYVDDDQCNSKEDEEAIKGI